MERVKLHGKPSVIRHVVRKEVNHDIGRNKDIIRMK